jgi:glucokinase
MYLGIEIGGTKLQLGIGPGDGSLRALVRVEARPEAGAHGILQQILAAVPDTLRQARAETGELIGVGVGFGGPVDDATRRVLKSHQVHGWADFPLAETLERELQIPVALGNDADVAGLAEVRFGAARDLSPVFYTNVGSGIGGSLIIDGRIYRGCGRGAGEIGHLWSRYAPESFTPVDAAHWQILEQCSSGWAMARSADVPSTVELARAAESGDQGALAILTEARRRYAIALSHVIALLCPRRIILGGGVSLMDTSLWLEPLREELAAIAFRPFADCYDIALAALGEAVVVHGAIALAADSANRA